MIYLETWFRQISISEFARPRREQLTKLKYSKEKKSLFYFSSRDTVLWNKFYEIFICILTFEKVYYSFPDGGNKASSKIWDLIAFDQPEEILKTKIQVSHLYKLE